MFLNRVLPGSSLEMCHHSIVTGAAASDGAASDGAASEATADGATSDAAELGAVVAPPPVQAPNTRAITPIAPSNRQRVVTADLLSFLAPPRGSRSSWRAAPPPVAPPTARLRDGGPSGGREPPVGRDGRCDRCRLPRTPRRRG